MATWKPKRNGRTTRDYETGSPPTSPLRRLGFLDDITTAALFLASDAASWFTGQTFVVDGGTTALPSGGVGSRRSHGDAMSHMGPLSRLFG